jgi:hypothetical protein
MKRLINNDYRNYLNNLSWYDFEINCPRDFNYVIDRLKNSFTYEQFLIECDFVAFELPLNPADYSDADWIAIGDWVDECNTPQFDYSLIY